MNYKIFWIILFFMILALEAQYVFGCEDFGCKPYVNCMPCEVLRDAEGELQSGGWCWIRKSI